MLKISLNKYHLFWIFIGVLIILTAVFTPLVDEDEGLMATISKSMLESKDFLTPKVFGENRFDKPPLFNWFQVISFYFFGFNSFTARLPAILFSGVWIFFISKIQKAAYPKSDSHLLFLLFFCSLQLIVIFIAGIQESLVNTCFTAMIYYFFYEDSLHPILRKILFSCFAGFAFLAKGPFVILLFGLIIFCIAVFLKSSKYFRFLFSIYSIFPFLILTSPWLFAVYFKHGNDFFDSFFLNHNLNRFLITKEGHGGTVFYYIGVIIVGHILILPYFWKLLKSILKSEIEVKSLVLLVWFVVIFIFFSFSATKLPHYILIGMPPILILISGRLELDYRKMFWFFNSFWILIFLVLLGLYFELIPFNDFYIQSLIKDSKLEIIQILIFNFFVIMGFNGLFLSKKHMGDSMFLIAGLNAILTLFLFYQVGNVLQKPVIEVAEMIKSQNLKVSVQDHYNPSLAFYSDRKIKIGGKGLIFEKAKPILPKDFKIIYQQNGFWLIEKTN